VSERTELERIATALERVVDLLEQIMVEEHAMEQFIPPGRVLKKGERFDPPKRGKKGAV
jgi:hypothetical protein